MTSSRLPQPPQTGIQPMYLDPEAAQRILSQNVEGERSDLWVSDSDEELRHMARLMLRKEMRDAADYFALGDRCAVLAIKDEELRILYMGKALRAYHKARQHAVRQVDRERAQAALEQFIRWTMIVAQLAPSARNLAAALWAAADIPVERQSLWIRETAALLAHLYPNAGNGDYAPHEATEQRVQRQTVESRVVNMQDIEHEQASPSAAMIEEPPLAVEAESAPRESGSAAASASVSATVSAAVPAPEDDPLESPHEEETEADEVDLLLTDASEPLSAPVPFVSEAPDAFEIEAQPLRDSAPTADESNAVAPAAMPIGQPLGQPVVQPTVNTAVTDFQAQEWLFDRDPAIQRDRYQVRRVVRGGMGVVYLCRDHVTGGAVAIKTFQGKFLDNERAIARFEQEAKIWISLDKHPNIVQARKIQRFSTERIVERPHIILEYVAPAEHLSSDLRSWIDAQVLTLPLILDIALDICRGMQHAVNTIPTLVHRDLKPGNILVRYDGLAKVTDFGLVRTLENAEFLQAFADADPDDPAAAQRLTRDGAIVGTAPYMSPEQCRAERTDQRSDIYAFGVILYEMLTGRPIFEAHSFTEWLTAHQIQIPAFPSEQAEKIPPQLQVLVLQCLAKFAADRPASWEAVLQELSAAYRDLLAIDPPPLVDTDMEVADLMDKAYGLSEIGFHAEATATYDRALSVAPTAQQAWIWGRKANTLRVSGDYAAARTAFDQALALDADQAWAWYHRGLTLDKLNLVDAALESYAQAAQRRPADARILVTWARRLLATGNPTLAEQKAVAVIEQAPHNLEAHSLYAQALLAQRQYNPALEAYDRLLLLSPSYGWGWYGKGKLLRTVGQLPAAIYALREATRLLTDQHWAWWMLADALNAADQASEALIAIQQVTVRLMPNFASGWVLQAQILVQLQRDDDALASYDRALTLTPDLIVALAGKVSLYERQRRYEAALVTLTRLRELGGETPRMAAQQGRLLVALKRYADALAPLARAANAQPTQAQTWIRLGQAQRHLKQHAAAIDSYQRALAIDDSIAWVWNELGLAYDPLGEVERSLAAFERASMLRPAGIWYQYNRANALYKLGRYQPCFDVLASALNIDPDHLESWSKRGQTLRQLGRHKDALKAFQKALAIKPEAAYVLDQQGQTLAEMDRHDEALVSFDHAIALLPTHMWFHLHRIEALIALGQTEAALEQYDALAARLPSQSIPLTRKGELLRKVGQPLAALEAFEAALRRNTHDMQAWYGQGRTQKALGQVHEAIATMQTAVQQNPTSVTAWSTLGDILLGAGDPRSAIAAFERALAINSTHAISMRLLLEARKRLK